MPVPEPFCREAGAGPGVVCLHSNASSSAQWRGLMDRLAPNFQVLAPDSYGSGKSPEWHSDRVIALSDEVALIEPVLARAGRRPGGMDRGEHRGPGRRGAGLAVACCCRHDRGLPRGYAVH
jgi:pimeloyl-ACP methyl ester carboxylesterase